MYTQNYLERFSIDPFIAGCSNLDWLGMFVRCQNTAMLAESARIPTRFKYMSDLRTSFTLFVNEFYFILTKGNNATVPDGMSEENFLKLKPLIVKLVKEKELKRDWLKLYE